MDKHWAEGLPEFKESDGPVTCINEEDTGGAYEFDSVAILKNGAGYHVVSSSGCSCPSHEDNAMHDAGPLPTYEEALAQVPETHRNLFPASEPGA